MSPASGKAPLRGVGPEDVDAAGELAPKVQDQNQAHELIRHVARSHPQELVTIQQLEEDAGRTKALDEEEVRTAAVDLVGDEERKGGLVKVLSARVKGFGRPVDQMWVVVLYETPSGRNARCAVPYLPEKGSPFRASIKAYDEGVAKGTITEGKATDSDQSHLEAQIRRQDATIKRLEAEAEQRAAEESGDTPPAGDGDTPEVELPEGVEAGDPGYPVDEETGDLLVLPDSVREELIEAHQAAEDAAAAAAGDGAPAETPEVDLDAVELPTGKADDLIAGMAFYSDDVVAALAKRDERSTVVKAAEAALKARAEADSSTED
jgi:hypothetical protein